MSVIDQILKNADWVRENFGPQSGLSDFGYNVESVAYIDGYIERNLRGATDRQTLAKFISLLGSFIGEALRSKHGGQWIVADNSPILKIQRGEMMHMVQPFGKVEKRIANGEVDSLVFFFNEFVPAILEGRAPPEWKIAELQPRSRRSWWKIW